MTAVAAQLPGIRLHADANRRILLRACLIAVIALGIFFRFYHLDRKVVSDDEIYTSLHLLGTTEAEVNAAAVSFTTAGQLRAVVHPGHAGIRSAGSTIFALAVEDPQHPPLYYLLGHYWIAAFGDSTFAIRLLSAVIGFAALPCMYWLCLELFADSTSAWLGTALLAISPINILYSQQAREYSLWTAVTLCMCAAFLRALRTDTARSWTTYAIALAIALYVDPLTAFGAVGNLVYGCMFGAANGRGRLSAIAATGAGFLLFAPWIVTVEGNLRHQVSHTMDGIFTQRQSPLRIMRFIGTMLRLNFFDVDGIPGLTRVIQAVELTTSLLVLSVVGCATAIAYRAQERRRYPFIFALIVFTLAPFALADLFASGQRTSCPRYFMPLYIGLDLAVLYVVAHVRSDAFAARGLRRAWWVVIAVIAGSRILAAAVSAPAQTWWPAYEMQAIRLAHTIDASHRPLLIGDDYVVYSLTLSNYLDPRTRVELQPRCYLCDTKPANRLDLTALSRTKDFGALYLLGPSKVLQADVRTALRSRNVEDRYHCIDVRNTCPAADPSSLGLYGG